MKVLHVSQPTSGGTAQVVVDIVRACVLGGHQVVVASPADGDLAARVVAAGADHVELPMSRTPGLADFRALFKLRELARDVDVIHLHSSMAGALGRFTFRSAKAPLVFTPHGWSWLVDSPLARVYRLVERLLAPVADAIVAVSETEAREGSTVLGGTNIQVIANGVDTNLYVPNPAVERDDDAIVCVGRLCSQKGQDIAIKTLALIEHRKMTLHLIGGGDSTSLESMAVMYGVRDRVVFHGHADPRIFYQSSAIVFQPSRWEGMALTMLEALASGATVVSTKVQGSEVLSGVGVVVDSLSPNDLARELDILLANGRMPTTNNGGRTRVIQEFSVERMQRDYLKLYDRLLAEVCRR